ncbi:cation transporter [Streptosporangium canum]|uniref:cation transporter n=1 Tax=Streptosporangium canum TaxID=324952 RepID=UPI00344371ED
MADHGHGHGHGVSAEADRRYLTGALLLIVGFMAIEVVIGFIAQSLALISDAGHMLTDAIAIVFALIAMRISARPPQGGFTYGLKRAEPSDHRTPRQRHRTSSHGSARVRDTAEPHLL